MPKKPPARRDVAEFLRCVRNMLLGRKHTISIRFRDELSKLSPPPPNLPEGAAHTLAGNYYCLRDPRGAVKPPVVIELTKQVVPPEEKKEEQQKEGDAKTEAKPKLKKLPTPGQVYAFDMEVEGMQDVKIVPGEHVITPFWKRK